MGQSQRVRSAHVQLREFIDMVRARAGVLKAGQSTQREARVARRENKGPTRVLESNPG